MRMKFKQKGKRKPGLREVFAFVRFWTHRKAEKPHLVVKNDPHIIMTIILIFLHQTGSKSSIIL